MIVVTGATGNVGSEVLRLLDGAGQPPRAAVQNVERARARFGPGVEVVHFDFADPGTYAEAFPGARRLFLVRPPAIADAKGKINPAVDAALAAGVRQVVFLSLQGVERNPVVPHYRIEAHLSKTGVPRTLLRASFFMQNLSTTHAADIRDRNEIAVPAGNGRTSFVDARDVAAVAAQALLAGGETRALDLTGSEALTYGQVAEIFSRVLGRPIGTRTRRSSVSGSTWAIGVTRVPSSSSPPHSTPSPGWARPSASAPSSARCWGVRRSRWSSSCAITLRVGSPVAIPIRR